MNGSCRVYDQYNRVLFSIDAAKRVTKNVYDSNSRLTHQIRYSTPLASIDETAETALKKGEWLPEPHSDCCTESTLYDADGRLLYEINGDNFVIEHRYDSLGNQLETITYATALDLKQTPREQLKQPFALTESAEDRHHSYFYNDASELIGEQLPAGHVIAYNRNAQGELLAKVSTLAALPRLSSWDAELIAQVPQKTEMFELDARGQCLAFTNAENSKTIQSFDAAGRKLSSSHGDETQTFSWDVLNRATQESHSSGLEIKTSYAPCGKVESETRIDTLVMDSPARIRHFRYNGFGQVTNELSPRVAAKLDDNELDDNERIRHTYNANGLRVSSQDELGNASYFYYNAAQELCFSINPTGSITEFTYDTVFHKPQSTRHYATCLNQAEMAWLAGGIVTPELITFLHSKQNSQQDECESIQYNKRGLAELTTDAQQYTTENEYDAFENLRAVQRQIDKNNHVVSQIDYDAANRPISKIHDVGGIHADETWEYLDAENTVIHTDANLNQTKTVFDKLDRKIKVIDALGHETSFTWDDLSRPSTTTDAMGNTTTLSYENNGRTIRTTTALSTSIIASNAFGEIELVQNADGEITLKIHDVDGQLKTEIDAEGNQTHHEYNIAGWLERVIEPLNKVTRYEHDASGHIKHQIEDGLCFEDIRLTVFERDAQGREILRVDPNGHQIKTAYDRRGLEILNVIDPENLNLAHSREYDGLRNCVKESKSSAQGDEFVTKIVRDNLGRACAEIVDPDGLKLTSQVVHDPAGNVIASIDANQHTTRFIYDAANRERYRIDPMGGVIGKIYDEDGLCIEERQYVTSLPVATFNAFNLVTVESLIVPNEADKVIYHTYDAENHEVASLDNRGKLTTYGYNAQGKKTQEIQYAKPFAKDDFPTKLPLRSEQDRQSAWFYDKNGNERFAINGEGIVTLQRWNEKGWLIEKRVYAKSYTDYTTCPDSSSLAHPDDRSNYYLHDLHGRVIFELNNEGYVTEYGYDDGDKPTIVWSYPNKITLPNVLTLESIYACLPDDMEKIPCVTFEYDAAYRKIASTDELHYREEFKLDALGNLCEYIDKGGDSWLFEVDKAGRKVAESTPPVEITAVSADGEIIKTEGKQRIVKKIEYDGDIERVTEAYGTPDARTIELHHNACKQIIKTVQDKVLVLANAPDGSRIETLKQLTTATITNAYQKPIVTVDEAGNLQFKVYERDQLKYEIDQEGFVTSYEYNVFGNVIQLTRHATALALDLNVFATTGLSVSDLHTHLKLSPADRHIYFEYDKANRPTQTSQDAVFIAIPQVAGDAKYGQYSPTKINEYNSFGEIACERELVDPFNQEFNKQWEVKRKWFDRAGHVVAQLDGLNYLTTFAPDWRGNNEEVIEYAKKIALPITADMALSEVLQAQERDKDYDRRTSRKFDLRGDLVKAIQHDVALHRPEFDVNRIANLAIQDKQSIEQSWVRNAKGQAIQEVLPNGAIKITDYDARNLPILKTEPSRQLETGPATPVTTIAYNAFAQPTRVTHHANPYENTAYLKHSLDDQISLTGYDTRGLPIVSVDPEGAVRSQGFTETKKLARSWFAVTGWAEGATPIKRLHQAIYEYDKRGIESLRCESVENGSAITTATRTNAFGEKEAEGPGDGSYPAYWLHDKTGAVWNSNAEGGVPTITLHDAHGQDTLTLRSRTRSLAAVDNDSALNDAALAKIMQLDYRDLQRLQLRRDVKGRIEAQCLPAFKTLKADAPEPYYTEITSGGVYGEFGKTSLSWPQPAIQGLEVEVSIWVKGHEDEAKYFSGADILTSGNRSGINTDDLPTDDYQYQIDFYYRDPQNGQRDTAPRLRAQGNTLIITDKFTASDNIIWQQIDDQHLMLTGNVAEVSGVELLQDGKPVGRVAVTSTDKPNSWLIDLSDKPSGRYEFRLLYGYSLLEDAPLVLGVPSASGTRIDFVHTELQQQMHLMIGSLNGVLTSSWKNLPPQIDNLHQELAVINASAPRTGQMISGFANYSTQTVPLDLQTGDGSSQVSFHNDFFAGVYSFPRFSSTVSKNRLFTIDAENKEWTVAETINPLHAIPNSNPSYLYLQPGQNLGRVAALKEHIADDDSGKIFNLNPWIKQSSRCLAPYSANHPNYDLISLETSVPANHLLGEITIHTANSNSNQLLVREIPLTKITTSKIATISNFTFGYYNIRDALNYKWSLPDDLTSNLLKANVQLHFNHEAYKKAYGENYTFEYLIGKDHHGAYNGPLLPIDGNSKPYKPAFTDFDFTHLNLQMKWNEDWIPLINSADFTKDTSIHRKPFSYVLPATWDNVTHTYSIGEYDEGDISTFPDSFTLLFYPLPPNIASFDLQYYDTSIPKPIWRPIADAVFTGHAISAPANALATGKYQFRLRANDAAKQSVNLSTLAPQTRDGWTIGEFTVAHGGSQPLVSRTIPEEEVVKPVREQTLDRWDNVISSTTASGNTTDFDYNGRNKQLSKTDPEIEITEEDGTQRKVRPQTHMAYDSCDSTVAVCDANNNITSHVRDNDGAVLKTTRADGVFKEFIPDIFGNTKIVRDPLKHEINYQHDRCNNEILRRDACGWETSFTYNERGDRLSVTKGAVKETDRYDYLHPSNQPTHHYLPGGDSYLTKTDFDRNGCATREQFPDGRQNTWEINDYFGNVSTHKDLGGAVVTYERNEFYPTELSSIKSEGGHHGERLSRDGTIIPMSDQEIVYQYDDASHVITILDNALPLTTLYRYDCEGHRARETFIASDGHIHQAVVTQHNALDWITKVEDTIMQVNYAYDAKGNRRSTIASMYNEANKAWDPVGEQNWYTYTAADNMAINRGLLIDGKIQITPKQGTVLLYDIAGRREHEINGNQVDKHLFYLDNDLLEHTESTDLSVNRFGYDNQVARRSLYATNTTLQDSKYTANSWLYEEDYQDRGQRINSSTTYDLKTNGLPYHQTTHLRNFEDTDGYDDSVKTEYVQFEVDKVARVEGERQRVKGKKSKSEVKASYDPNGNTETIVGDNQEPRHFITNSENRIVEKTLGWDKEEHYFYTPDGEVLGYFGNIPPEPSLRGEITNSDFDLNYHPVSEHFPPPAPSAAVVMQGDTFESISERVYGDKSFANLIADVNGYRKQDIPPPGLVLQIPNIVNTNLHNWAGQYPVYNPAAIVGSIYPNMPMPVRLRLPWEHPRPKRPNFWHVLLETLVYTLVMAFAPELSGAMFEVMGEFLGQLAGYALAGATASLAQQGTAIALNDQHGLSWQAIGQSAATAAVTAGITRAFKIDPSNIKNFEDFASNVGNNLELSAAIQGISVATGQQDHFDWRAMVTSMVSTMANVAANQFDMGSKVFNDALTTTSATMATLGTNKIIGGNYDVEAMVANVLGTVIGNQLAYQAKEHYKRYQDDKRQKDFEAEQRAATHGANGSQDSHGSGSHGSQIPSLHDEIDALNDEYIQGMKYHGDERGVFASSDKPTPPSSGSKKPKPSAKNDTAYNAEHRNDHLKDEHAQQEARMAGAEQQADAKNTITGSGYGFFGSSENSGSSFGDLLRDAVIQGTVSAMTAEGSILANEAGRKAKAIASVANELLNPFAGSKIPEEANEAVAAFRAGESVHGILATRKVLADIKHGVDELAIMVVGGEVAKPLAGALLKPVVKTVGTVAKKVGAYVSKLSVFGSKGKSTNLLLDILKTAKPTPGKPHQLEAILEDETKVIFRRDIGEHSHPIGKDYPAPTDHYNIEIHTPNSSRPGKYIPQENMHIIVDRELQPLDIFLKDKTRLGSNFSKKYN